MEYIQIIKKIEFFIDKNKDILELLYPREFDCRYALILSNIKKGNNQEQLKNDINNFFIFRGIKSNKIIELLRLFDNNKKNITSVDNNIDKIFELYCFLIEKTKKITGKNQYVFTTKLMNLYNQHIPLYDNNVINFLQYLDIDIERYSKKAFFHILNIYKIINEKTNIPNIMKLKNSIYCNMEIEFINLNKFVDTLFYFINDTVELEKYRLICNFKKVQVST